MILGQNGSKETNKVINVSPPNTYIRDRSYEHQPNIMTSWLLSSFGRALHRFRRGHGFKSHTSLHNLFSGLIFNLLFSSVHSCENLLYSFLHRSAHIWFTYIHNHNFAKYVFWHTERNESWSWQIFAFHNEWEFYSAQNIEVVK